MWNRLKPVVNLLLAGIGIKTPGPGKEGLRRGVLLGVAVSNSRKLKPEFELGQVFISRRVLEHFPLPVIDEILQSYAAMDGVDPFNYPGPNECALLFDGPIFSFWRDEADTEVYLVTDDNRSRTLVMMSAERGVLGQREGTRVAGCLF